MRVPAAWCGVTGLKTTLGRISVHGVLPLAESLDTPGPRCAGMSRRGAAYKLLQGPTARSRDGGSGAGGSLPQLSAGCRPGAARPAGSRAVASDAEVLRLRRVARTAAALGRTDGGCAAAARVMDLGARW